ncbi:MAG TPA: ABC transporter ATP-binding protein [Kineosporiaceae bacterium]|nr:ABC transporter ATP-binding protein [Kineosporiaceae bacterium]
MGKVVPPVPEVHRVPDVQPASHVLLDGVSKRYGTVDILREVCVDVPARRRVGLIGVNGAGKTTLLRILAGLASPDSGAVRLVEEGGATRPLTSRDLALVPQAKPLFPVLTAAEHLALAAGMNRGCWDGDLPQRWLRDFGVPADRPAGRLSGGERSQLAIALALGRQVPVLLMDEPFAELDPLARDDATTALAEHVTRSGRTLLVSSHVIADVERLCDRIVVLTHGRVVLSGDTGDLLAGPGERSLSDVVLPVLRSHREAR